MRTVLIITFALIVSACASKPVHLFTSESDESLSVIKVSKSWFRVGEIEGYSDSIVNDNNFFLGPGKYDLKVLMVKASKLNRYPYRERPFPSQSICLEISPNSVYELKAWSKGQDWKVRLFENGSEISYVASCQ